MIKIIFFNENKYTVAESFVQKIAMVAASHEKKLSGIIELALVDNSKIRSLNRIWRGKNKITDVLSFAWTEEKKITGEMLGQIFISYPRILKQSKEYNVPVKEELARMITHGLLHLAGYKHGQTKNAKKMFALQEVILTKVLQ